MLSVSFAVNICSSMAINWALIWTDFVTVHDISIMTFEFTDLKINIQSIKTETILNACMD